MANSESLFTSHVARSIAATLGAIVAAVIVTAGMPTYLPLSQTDSIGLPILLFPLTWFFLFLFSALCKNVWHAWLLIAVLTLSHAGLIAVSLS